MAKCNCYKCGLTTKLAKGFCGAASQLCSPTTNNGFEKYGCYARSLTGSTYGECDCEKGTFTPLSSHCDCIQCGTSTWTGKEKGNCSAANDKCSPMSAATQPGCYAFAHGKQNAFSTDGSCDCASHKFTPARFNC